jgi:hypothetical protein
VIHEGGPSRFALDEDDASRVRSLSWTALVRERTGRRAKDSGARTETELWLWYVSLVI